MAAKTSTIKLPDGKTLEYPMLSGTIGPDVIDIRKLYGQSGMFTYDPGFLSTASCSSSITYIDGDAGVLLYRGYPIDQLAQPCDFLEVCYLLLNGELPDKRQKDEFVGIVTHHTMVHEQLARLYQGFRRDAHPMAVMVGEGGGLGGACTLCSHRFSHAPQPTPDHPPRSPGRRPGVVVVGRKFADHRRDVLQ